MADSKRSRALRGARSQNSTAPGRAAWGSISRQQIIEAGVRSLREKGFDGVTIRGLAAEMGVAPMSLYRHVRDKDDLLDEVVEVLFHLAWRPRGRRDDWKSWIAEAADRLRRFLVDEPAALYVYLRHPVVTPTALARMEAMMEVLEEELGSPARARVAFGALQTYTIGFAALEVSRDRTRAAGHPAGRTERVMAAFITPSQFRAGVDLLLTGVEQESALAT